MCKRNWKQYNKSLVERGSISFLFSKETFKRLKAKKQKQIGRPEEFSDLLIQVLMMIKIHFNLPYRMLEGFAKETLHLVKIPTYSLICKRAAHLQIPHLSSNRPHTVIIDATGIKVLGEGEWKIKMHGVGRPRKWIKLHVAIDANTQEIVAACTTKSYVSDPKVAPTLLKQVKTKLKKVIGDGAYDTNNVRNFVRKRGGKSLFPPRKNAVCNGIDEDRDRAIKDINLLGGDNIARSLWKKLHDYHRRSLVETTFSRYKRRFGDKAFSKTFERQVVENQLKCMILNKMMAA